MAHPFDGATAKLDRAERHLNVFKEKIGAFLGPYLYQITKHPNVDDRQWVFRIHFNRTINERYWGLLVGDFTHNVRCALDYAIWELAELHDGPHPEDRRTMFPIFDRPDLFEERGRMRIGRLDQRAKTMVARLQPYCRRNTLLDPLRLLEELNSTDKHKLLTFTTTAAVDAVMPYRVPPGYVVSKEGSLRISGVLEEGAIVAILTFTESPPTQPPIPAESEVDVDVDPTIEVVLRGSPLNPDRYFVVRDALPAILRHARKIVALFRAHYDKTLRF